MDSAGLSLQAASHVHLSFSASVCPRHATCVRLPNRRVGSHFQEQEEEDDDGRKVVCRSSSSSSSSRRGARTEKPAINGTPQIVKGVNGQESRMVPVKEASQRTSTLSTAGERKTAAKGIALNGTLTNRTLSPSNNSTLTALPGENSSSRLKQSKNFQTSLESLPWDENTKNLPSDESFSWSKDNYSSAQRTIDVWSFVLALRVRVYLDGAKFTYIGGFSEERQKKRRRRTASWVRERILQLGPTFIKLGQLSSTRSDLFPAEFVEELSKLQDRVPAFTPEKALALVEKELGQPVDSLFTLFEKQPIAAASLGQVHRAVLPNGDKVVVKIQRPGLKELFDIDLMRH